MIIALLSKFGRRAIIFLNIIPMALDLTVSPHADLHGGLDFVPYRVLSHERRHARSALIFVPYRVIFIIKYNKSKEVGIFTSLYRANKKKA